jgi:hypothetical protein
MIPGHQIGSDLVKALGLPKFTRSFTLHCDAGEAVTVSCVYYPDDGDIAPALAVYDLVERPAPRQAQSIHFDTWLRDRTERAHREFMERTANLPLCDTSIEGIARYMGTPI